MKTITYRSRDSDVSTNCLYTVPAVSISVNWHESGGYGCVAHFGIWAGGEVDRAEYDKIIKQMEEA